jgi:hypothetical protein
MTRHDMFLSTPSRLLEKKNCITVDSNIALATYIMQANISTPLLHFVEGDVPRVAPSTLRDTMIAKFKVFIPHEGAVSYEKPYHSESNATLYTSITFVLCDLLG